LPATLIGYWLSDAVPNWVTYALLFVNPLFFLMSFTEVPIRSNQLAILFGGLSSIYFFQHYPSNALLISGVGVGSLIYLIDLILRKFSRNKN
jgi:predicted branched-subunit amino acid permease